MNTDRNCHSCRYTIEIRHNAGLGYRTYVWKGGEETAIITPDNPATPENEEVTETTDWCFAFGEGEWLEG